jgi:16S rRNA (guanine527-N7)-methyltransferase
VGAAGRRSGEESHSPTVLWDVLSEAREAGFFGPASLDLQLAHAEAFAVVGRQLNVAGPQRPHLLDLGSGGGLPGLVVAARWPEASLTLVEANARRAAFLRRAVASLKVDPRVSVIQERAEVCGRDPELRAHFDGVISRSFGRPAVVAECAAPLLRVGGWLVVSEPPPPEESRPRPSHEADQVPPDAGGSPEPPRWPAEGLGQLGLKPLGVVREGFDFMTLFLKRACPSRFPRRNGVPAKRPLF